MKTKTYIEYSSWIQCGQIILRKAVNSRVLAGCLVSFALFGSMPEGQAALVEAPNMAALRAINPSSLTDGDKVCLAGYYVDGDLGGGWFVWGANTNELDDGG